MAEPTGELWAVIQEWIDAQPYPPSQRKLATRIGVGHSTVTDWKYRRTLPAPEDLRALAIEIRVPYERVLDAALRDHGYRERVLDAANRDRGRRDRELDPRPPRKRAAG